MGVLSELEPKKVFHYFEEISRIPRPSYHEEKISDYLVEFARARGLEYYQDELKNVIIIKEAAPGYEDVEPLILQGHMDMVCEKEPGCTIDFERDGLELCIEGDDITARGTTLGGDDGIAVAYALAILDSDDIPHPRLEFICTVAEEVGMDGAMGLDVSMLKGRKLLNLDSEEEGIMLVSCAGGCSAQCILPMEWEQVSGQKMTIEVSGLKGGHSGTEIDKGRANANVLMGRILLELEGSFPYRIVSLAGGSKDNAIPRESRVQLVLPDHMAAQMSEQTAQIAETLCREYSTSDPDICVKVTGDEAQGVDTEVSALTESKSHQAVALLNILPNGIQRMSDDIRGLVETSLNLGVLLLKEDELSLRYAVRSSVGSAKEYLLRQLSLITGEMGGNMACSGNYPAWEYRKDSVLREDMIRIFQEMYGREPQVEAIHAGLECGILAGKIEDLDCVSIGPDMQGVHTTEEKLSISSTRRTWDYVLRVIACK
ncbi:MAG: aminoacyl-histidine dipeptidase [Lachnospiraceae bacterium]|nr:aminoacyl-histidine dipeptidase [Lachnospiraceae bacterium]